ncbi:hypothetical protein [Paraconexibacter sp.]|uniref:hypothetical protein n=1 Tax=Paraconexibacter sp. TaxID=2949640 RepID=UPI003562E965
MSTRKRAFLLAIGLAGAVAALSGALLAGCVAIGFAVEAYVVCHAYCAPATGSGPSADDEPGGGDDDGGWRPPDAPPDPWPPMDPAARDVRREPVAL